MAPATEYNYQPLLARRVAQEVPALFRAGSASPAGVIPLTYGFPDPDSFPIEALIAAAARMLQMSGRDALQYGPIAGPEPFLDLLVELQWNTGRLVREYTFLLDPPEYKGPGALAAAPAPAPVVPAQQQPAPAPSAPAAPEPARPAAPIEATPIPAAPSAPSSRRTGTSARP